MATRELLWQFRNQAAEIFRTGVGVSSRPPRRRTRPGSQIYVELAESVALRDVPLDHPPVPPGVHARHREGEAGHELIETSTSASSRPTCRICPAHLLRAPIGHIIGYAEMMAEELTGSTTTTTSWCTTSGCNRRLGRAARRPCSSSTWGPSKQSTRRGRLLPRPSSSSGCQLNHISGYTEMLRRGGRGGGAGRVARADLERIATAEQPGSRARSRASG